MAYDALHKSGTGAWAASGVGTNAGVTVTHTIASGNLTSYVTHISGSGDAAALVTIESPSGTPIWRKRFAAAFTFDTPFPVTYPAAYKQNVILKISASTSNCEANIAGYDG